jgi:hypothetical protein
MPTSLSRKLTRGFPGGPCEGVRNQSGDGVPVSAAILIRFATCIGCQFVNMPLLDSRVSQIDLLQPVVSLRSGQSYPWKQPIRSRQCWGRSAFSGKLAGY